MAKPGLTIPLSQEALRQVLGLPEDCRILDVEYVGHVDCFHVHVATAGSEPVSSVFGELKPEMTQEGAPWCHAVPTVGSWNMAKDEGRAGQG